MPYRICLASCIAIFGAGAAAGQQCGLCEDYDDYALGDLCAQTAWEEWPDRQGMDGCGAVSDEQAFNGSQSLKIVGEPGGPFGFGDRFFQRVDLYGGYGEYTMMLYVPASSTGSATLSIWGDADLNLESVRLRIDADNDTVTFELTGRSLPLILDRWVFFRIRFDLNQRLADCYYDRQSLGEGPLVTHAVSAISFHGGEPGGGITAMYVDDLYLSEQGCVSCDANCDGVIDVFDIEPFLALLRPNPVPCSPCAGDVDLSGTLDAFDIEPFVECLLGH